MVKYKQFKISLSVDTIGLYCPLPVVELKLGLENIKTGEIVELVSDDPGIEKDLPEWCTATGNILLSITKEKDIFTAYVKKS